MSKDCVEKFFRLYSGFQSVKSNGILRKKTELIIILNHAKIINI